MKFLPTFLSDLFTFSTNLLFFQVHLRAHFYFMVFHIHFILEISLFSYQFLDHIPKRRKLIGSIHISEWCHNISHWSVYYLVVFKSYLFWVRSFWAEFKGSCTKHYCLKVTISAVLWDEHSHLEWASHREMDKWGVHIFLDIYNDKSYNSQACHILNWWTALENILLLGIANDICFIQCSTFICY